MSPETAGERQFTEEDLGWARKEFIDTVYPDLFGRNYNSDTTVEITSLNVTKCLLQYERILRDSGLLNVG